MNGLCADRPLLPCRGGEGVGWGGEREGTPGEGKAWGWWGEREGALKEGIPI